MLDHLIMGGLVADGLGSPVTPADVAIRDGVIVAVAPPGSITEEAANTIDATGRVVCPGFVDPHTHYDAQLFWDPFATPSNVHGVTSIIGGNCGFTLAPIKPDDADYLRRMMAKVEGMPLAALETGVDWNWSSFAEYLERLDGNVAVNAGFLVGHCALRRFVMGTDAIGNEATPAQINSMVEILHESIEAGGLGFSTTLARTHADGDGQPVASRWASHAELIALSAAIGEHEGTTLEGIVDGCLEYFSEDEIDLLVAMTVAARRPINWNVLTVDSKRPDQIERQLAAGTRAEKEGGRIVALTMPVQVPMNMSFLNYCALNMLPDWGPILALPLDERLAKLGDADTRRFMEDRAHSDDAGVFARLTDFGNYVLGDTYSEANEGLKGRVVRDIAADRGADPFDTLVEIVINDSLRTVLWPIPTDGDDESWRMRQDLWSDPRAMIGGSDAGAHLDRMCGSSYTTRFLGDCIRGRKLVPMERAIQMLTSQPAQLFGLRDRGVLVEGAHADVVVFDPDTIGADHATLVHDLPGETGRLIADAYGIVRVLVNGVVTVIDNKATGAIPGKILRAGADTATVDTSLPVDRGPIGAAALPFDKVTVMRLGEIANASAAEYGKPLDGVRVLAAEQMQALPFATQLLARLGAEVIKVEHPTHGESGRGSSPAIPDPDGRMVGATYLRNNLDKRSVGIDLKAPEGRELFLSLVPKFDVVCENFKAGTMDRMGLGYDDIAAVHPRSIYLSISGFGNGGHGDLDPSPYRAWPAYASVVEAMSGIYEYKSGPTDAPTTIPMGAIGDISSALFATIGVLAALRHRDRTGEGQYVDIAMLDAMIAMTDVVTNFWSMGVRPDPENALEVICEGFKADDGYVVVQIVREPQFFNLGDLVGHPEWRDDPQFASRKGWMPALDSVIRPAVETWLVGHTKLEAAQALTAAGIVAGPSNSASDVIDDPHVAARHMLVEMPRTDGFDQPILIPGNPVKLSKMAEGPETRVPWVGEHTDAILADELGLDAGAITSLRIAGVIT